jgi:hypothetical protein
LPAPPQQEILRSRNSSEASLMSHRLAILCVVLPGRVSCRWSLLSPSPLHRGADSSAGVTSYLVPTAPFVACVRLDYTVVANSSADARNRDEDFWSSGDIFGIKRTVSEHNSTFWMIWGFLIRASCLTCLLIQLQSAQKVQARQGYRLTNNCSTA